MTISRKQLECLTFIVNYIGDHGFPPSVREVMDGMGLASPSTAQQHIRALASKGYLQVTDGNTRSLKVNTKAIGFCPMCRRQHGS